SPAESVLVMVMTRILNPWCYTAPWKYPIPLAGPGRHRGPVPTGGHHGIHATRPRSVPSDRLGDRHRRIHYFVYLSRCSVQSRRRSDFPLRGGSTYGKTPARVRREDAF